MHHINIISACGLLVSAGLVACSEPTEQPADVGFDEDRGIPDGDGGNAPLRSATGKALPPATNRPPVIGDLDLEVEVGGLIAGRIKAVDPEGDPITFAVAGDPSQGTLVSFDAAAGVFVYQPSSTVSGTDSFTVQAADAANPAGGQGTVTVNIKPFNMFRPWVATGVVVNGSTCSNTEIALTRTGNVVVIAPRPYRCGSVTRTLGTLTLDVVGNSLYQQGVLVGTLTGTSLAIEQSTFLSGCGQIGYKLRIQAGPGGYTLDDEFNWGTCPGSIAVHADLKRGAHLSILSSGAFGSLPFPGPHERTIHLASDGDIPARAPAAGALAAPFSFKGGAYPGTGGTCDTGLASGALCSVVVTAGGTAGMFTGNLALDYSNGARTVPASLPLSVELWRRALLQFGSATGSFGAHELAALPISNLITVRNVGTFSATSMAATLTGSAFAFQGGAYPGTGGSCGASLASGATCTLALVFSAIANGRYTGNLALSYEGGTAGVLSTLPLSGAAASVIGHGLYEEWNSYARDIVPYYDYGGIGARLLRLGQFSGSSYKELALDPASNTFFATNRHYLASRITPAGAITDITPGFSWPRAAAVDPTRNRLVIMGSDGTGLRDLSGSTWAYLPAGSSQLETMKYRAADDTFVGLDWFDLHYLADASGTLRVLSAATLAPTAMIPLDFSEVNDLYFDQYSEHTQIISATDKIRLITQVMWWSTGAAAAAGNFDMYKVAGYEIDRQTGKVSLAWELPENIVQPVSETKLHGISIYEGCSTPPCIVDVAVNTGADTVLLLNSYAAVTWRLAVFPGSSLRKVIVRGQAQSTVLNAGAATVDAQTWARYASRKGTTATQLRYQAENMTQLRMSSLQLAYQQSSFTVGP